MPIFTADLLKNCHIWKPGEASAICSVFRLDVLCSYLGKLLLMKLTPSMAPLLGKQVRERISVPQFQKLQAFSVPVCEHRLCTQPCTKAVPSWMWKDDVLAFSVISVVLCEEQMQLACHRVETLVLEVFPVIKQLEFHADCVKNSNRGDGVH